MHAFTENQSRDVCDNNVCRVEKSVINVVLRIISFSTSVGSTMEEGDMESGGKTDERMRKRDEDVGGDGPTPV